MKMDETLLTRLRSLDDSQLRALIGAAADAMGAPEAAKRQALAHTSLVRRRLRASDGRDLEKLLDSLGEEKTAQLLRGLKG